MLGVTRSTKRDKNSTGDDVYTAAVGGHVASVTSSGVPGIAVHFLTSRPDLKISLVIFEHLCTCVIPKDAGRSIRTHTITHSDLSFRRPEKRPVGKLVSPSKPMFLILCRRQRIKTAYGSMFARRTYWAKPGFPKRKLTGNSKR